jgi:glycosyltransferase involved in cell wall biosynthesis
MLRAVWGWRRKNAFESQGFSWGEMRVCLYGYSIATRGNGSTQYAVDLSKWLLKNKTDVTLVTAKCGDRSAVHPALKYDFVASHSSPVSKYAQIDFALKSLLYFRKHRHEYDLIHSLSSFPEFGRLAAWIKKVCGLPVVHTLLAPSPQKRYFDALDGLIAVSRGIKEVFQSPRAVHIPPILDLGPFRSCAAYPWRESGDLLIGTMGAPFRRKGVRYVVEAIPLILKENPRVHFYLAIDLPGIQCVEETRREREYIGEFVRSHDLQDKVSFLGQVEVPRFLKSLDLFIYAVQTTMGMIDIPPTLLECLAAGCGVVTSGKDGVSELIDDGQNGLLVHSDECNRPEAYAKKILTLMQDGSLLGRIKEKGPATVEKFESERVGKEIVQFYQNVLENRRKKT